MKPTFAYIRVSTPKQGFGVSLQEQRAAVERYAQKQGLSIIQWFEERETAAKRGRPIFTKMLSELQRGKARAVVMHKIDRSARNLRDWADLRELADTGIEAHFASEGLDLQTRDRRLSADVQAVVAAAYIDNLREEAKKGFYGRLKQGVYPLPAPIGYVDKGAGNPKEPDPAVAPLIGRVFELYATGSYSITTLHDEVQRLGLRSRRGGVLSRSALAKLLSNPFYIGLIRIERTNETFRGAHAPIVTPQLFQRVQDILTGRTVVTGTKHQYLFRRLLKCAACGYSLVGEFHKGYVYYRCWRGDCITNCVREDLVEEIVLKTLGNIQLLPEEAAELDRALNYLLGDQEQVQRDRRESLLLQQASLKARMNRLVDAYVDQLIDQGTLNERRSKLLADEALVADQLKQLDANPENNRRRLNRYFELIKTAKSAYISASREEKRKLLSDITLNRIVSPKNVEITLKSAFQVIANRRNTHSVDRIGTYFELMARTLLQLSYDGNYPTSPQEGALMDTP